MNSYFKHRMRRKSPGEIVGWIALATVGIVALGILFGFVIMWLWNWLMPAIFGLGVITYWQAVGLFVLAKILIGGCGGGHKGKAHRRYKERFRERCEAKEQGEFNKWRYYDKFWDKVGEKAYREFMEHMKTAENKDQQDPSEA